LTQALAHGLGKSWLSKGRIFFGDLHQNKMNEGKMYEMQHDNTYTLYSVKYNAEQDLQKEVAPND
jgi:hypothetical protein